MATPLPSTRDRDLPVPLPLLAEAGAAMLAASLAIRLVPFRRIAAHFDRPPARSVTATTDQAYWVRRAVSAWGRRLPWRAKCFEQGIAAAHMLRRRGLGYTIHYGASQADDRLAAHVWVTSGNCDVVGGDTRHGFAPVAQFNG
jgi:hypothetical protein